MKLVTSLAACLAASATASEDPDWAIVPSTNVAVSTNSVPAFNIMEHFSKAMDNIFKPLGNDRKGRPTYQISIEDFVEGKITHQQRDDGSIYNSFKGKYFGSITYNHVIDWDTQRKVMSFSSKESGSFSHRMYKEMGINIDDPYKINTNLIVHYKNPAKAAIKGVVSGNVGPKKFKLIKNWRMKEAGMAGGNFKVKFVTDGSQQGIDNMSPEQQVLFLGMKDGSHKFIVKILVKKVCMKKGPFTIGCSATVNAGGNYNGQEMKAKNTYTFNKWAAILNISWGKERHIFKGKYTKPYWELTWTDKVGQALAEAHSRKVVSGATSLIVRMPSPNTWNTTVRAAGEEFAAPFVAYGAAVNVSDCAEVANAVTWVDTWWSTFTDEFDCGDLVRSTKFESELLTAFLKNQDGLFPPEMDFQNIQGLLIGGCAAVNQMGTGMLKGPASGMLDKGRKFVFNLTGKEGLARYNEVFSA